MDNSSITTLRKRIAIPVSTAVQLLRAHGGDIDACVVAYQQAQLTEICARADCDLATAQDSYAACQGDKTKAIARILARPVVLTMRDRPGPRNEVGYVLWPETGSGELYKTAFRNDAFIPSADFAILLDAFRSVYPLPSRSGDQVEAQFDHCGHNYFDRDTALRIVDRIVQAPAGDTVEQGFRKEVVAWLRDKLAYADYLVVYGNL